MKIVQNVAPAHPRRWLTPLVLHQLSVADVRDLFELSPEAGEHVALVEIAPDVAAYLLKHHARPENRDMTTSHIKMLADRMARGEWVVTGETLIFGDDGLVLNGHNRLHACIRAKQPFEVLIVANVDYETFPYLDSGKARGDADVFKMHGVVNYPEAASAAKWHYKLNGKVALGDPLKLEELYQYYTGACSTIGETRYLKLGSRLRAALSRQHGTGGISDPLCLALVMRMTQQSCERTAERFVESVENAVGYGLELWAGIAKRHNEGVGNKTFADFNAVAVMVCMAWNGAVRGRPVGRQELFNATNGLSKAQLGQRYEAMIAPSDASIV
jgi:hypothetical protein